MRGNGQQRIDRRGNAALRWAAPPNKVARSLLLVHAAAAPHLGFGEADHAQRRAAKDVVRAHQLAAPRAMVQLVEDALAAKHERVRVLRDDKVDGARAEEVAELGVGLVGSHDEGDATAVQHLVGGARGRAGAKGVKEGEHDDIRKGARKDAHEVACKGACASSRTCTNCWRSSGVIPTDCASRLRAFAA